MINQNTTLTCKDHTVSGEEFELLYDHDHDMLITSPKPSLEVLHKYYESEDYISHTDSRRGLFEKLYQIVKKYALSQKVQLIDQCNSGTGILLDIGAGTGDFLNTAKIKNWSVQGSEPNIEARKLAKEKGIHLEKDTGNYNSEFFDVITMWHVLEHVHDLDAQVLELKRLLKPGGYLIVAVPNFKSYDAKYYKEFWAAYDVPRHLWHFSKNSITQIFKDHFSLEKMLPMKFDAFYVALLSEKYKTGKMNFVRAFWNGIQSNRYGKRKNEYSSHIYVLKKTNN